MLVGGKEEKKRKQLDERKQALEIMLVVYLLVGLFPQIKCSIGQLTGSVGAMLRGGSGRNVERETK